ncbi:MAG: sulfite exporter TauE/SafE family protein [Clostridia bacterium]|nr:sulfite exporter TauE/SafE family protein [Clostridia bacterium]
MIWQKILICFIASAGAGIGTGFAGMSAAAIIGPLLSTFLDIPIYEAVGIGLASDVIASGISAYNYKKGGNLDVKNSIPLLVTVLVMTIVGSFVASLVPEQGMEGAAQISMIIIGLRFLIKPVATHKERTDEQSKKQRIIKSVIGGVFVGFICGFIGAGGGMMMLFVLTTFLGYSLHKAVGTSVFIMTFTALTGGISHFAIGGFPDAWCLVLCVVFTFIWAQIASKLANKAKDSTLNRIVGWFLIISSIVVLLVNYVL